ncbi:MAG: LptE family protein [Bacteroidota bacterium]
MNRYRPSIIRTTAALLLLAIGGCGTYSFTGASIPPGTESVSISFFENRASIIQPTLSSTFTEKLKDRFVSQTNLRLITADGDLHFEGYISDYQSRPVAIQGNDQAALNRLTITVSVNFKNKKDPKQDFDSSFSRYVDYDSRKNLSAVEQELIAEICQQLTEDIFNKAVINW